MKSFLNRVLCAVYFYLCYAPVMMLLSQWLISDFVPGLLAAALMLPLSLLVMLVPESLGRKRASKEAASAPAGPRGSGDPDPDRSLRSDALPVEKKQLAFPLRVAVLIFCTLAMVAAIVLKPPALMRDVFFGYRAIFAAGLGVMLMLAVFSIATGEAVNLRSSLTGVVVYLVVGFFSSNTIRDPLMARWLYFFGAGYLLVTGFLLNERALMAGAMSSQAYRPPSSIRWRNRIILTVFSLIVAGFACIDKLRQWTSTAFKAIVRAILSAIDWINRLLSSGEEIAFQRPEMMDSGFELFAKEAESGYDLSELIAMGLAVAILLAALVLAIWKFRKWLTRFRKSLQSWFARFSQGVSEEYVDVREKLTDYDEEREGFASGIRKRVAQLLRRDPKWNDLTPRDRVRFLLTLIYRKNVKAISGLSGLTAREALEQVNTPISDAEGFAALYDRARYSSYDISQDEAEKARRDVKL